MTLEFLLCLNGTFFDLKRNFIQILWIFNCSKCILVRLRVKVFVSQDWVQAEITFTIKFRVNLINFRTL